LPRPDAPLAPRATAVKDGRRPPPARSVLDGGEHGADPGIGRARVCRCVPRLTSVMIHFYSYLLSLACRGHGSLRGRHETASSWAQGVAVLQCSGANCSVMAYRRTTRDAQSSPPAVPARTAPRLRGARWRTNGQAIAASCIHQKSVPSVQMQCRMMASLRATATLAFLAPTRFISRTPHAFSGDQRLTLVSSTAAAS
jgi:hypothetical protein